MSAEKISSKIWKEIPEADNPFAASVCYCHGYDVYGEILHKASWVEYLYLLFKGERPTKKQAGLIEKLAIVLANPGPRDYSVRAAMNGGVGGSTNAAILSAALSAGAGSLGGGKEIVSAMEYWISCGCDFHSWAEKLKACPIDQSEDNWPPLEHPPGFDPNGTNCPRPVTQALECLSDANPCGVLAWLKDNRLSLENVIDMPLAITGVIAAGFMELEMEIDKAEMLYLVLRLPGAAVHALEQKHFGWRKYPFFSDGIQLLDDPATK